MISNNNNGSHTGHNLGTFVVDMNDYAFEQWGVSGTSSSSYIASGVTYAIGGALGKVTAPGTTTSNAWMAGPGTDIGEQWLELNYASAVNATGVKVFEGVGPAGFVTKIEVKDADGNYHTVWSGTDDAASNNRVLSATFDETDFLTKTVRVTVDTQKNGGNWEGIDAIQLIGNDADGSGLEDLAKDVGNDMIVNTNDNNQLYLDQAAQNVLYGTTDEKDQADDGYSTGYDDADQVTKHVHGNSGDYTWEASDNGNNLLLTKDDETVVLSAKVILEFHDKTVDTSSLFNLPDNVVRLQGNADDWGWDLTQDGKSVVWSATEFKILDAKVVLKFDDKEVDTSYLFEDEGGEGGSEGGENTVVLEGNSDEWGWDRTEDGEGVVVWSADDFKILDANVVLKFDDKEVDTSYLFEDEGGEGGGGEENVLVIDGDSDDYGWGPTEDGEGVVVWGENDFFKIVDAGTTLKFNDKTVETEAAGDEADNSGDTAGDDHSDHDADDMSDSMDDETSYEADSNSEQYYSDMVSY